MNPSLQQTPSIDELARRYYQAQYLLQYAGLSRNEAVVACNQLWATHDITTASVATVIKTWESKMDGDFDAVVDVVVDIWLGLVQDITDWIGVDRKEFREVVDSRI